MHRTYLADIERGGRNITLRSVARIAEALQIPAERLLQAELEDARSDILLVEDNEADVELTRREFEQARFANPIRVVRDGEAAIECLLGPGRTGHRRGASLPQLVLLDLNLPGITGVEVLRRLRNDPRTRTLPVVVLTASRRDRDIMECSRLGVDNYIIKPVSFDRFCQVTSKLSLRWALLQPAESRKQEVPDGPMDPGI